MNYRFDNFSLDTKEYLFTRDSEKIALEPRVFDLLVYLIENRNRIVTKEELIETLWSGRVITDAALNTCVRSVRRALGDDHKNQAFVRTLPKRGFQFVGTIKPDEKDVLQLHVPTKIQRWKIISVATVVILTGLVIFQLFPLTTPERANDRPSIAVLDFDSGQSDDTQRYFTEGLLEELVSSLARYRELFVIARNSSSQYQQRDSGIREIGQELGADYIVNGSVRYESENIHVTARMIDSRTGQQVWSTQFNQNQGEIYELQSELAYLIAGQIVPEVVKADTEKNSKKPPEVLDAWALYHKARTKQAVYQKIQQEEAIHFSNLALVRDPNLAAAHAVIARAKGAQFFYQWTDDRMRTLEEAISSAKTAIRLDQNDAGGYAALGYIYRFTGDETSSIANLERATTLNPSDANIKLEYAHALDWFRHQEKGLVEIDHAIKLSPRDPRLENMYFYKAHMQFHLFDFESSLKTTMAMSGVLTTDTWRVFYHLIRAANQAQLNDKEAAKKSVDAALKINPKLSITGMKKRFDGSKNHPENRRFWLESLAKAGIPE